MMKHHDPDLAQQLAAAAGVRLHRRPRVDLIPVADAGAFLDACARREVRVLGVEGFYLRGDEVHVDLERILDLSAVGDPAASVAEAKRFIAEVAVPSLMLDFTLT